MNSIVRHAAGFDRVVLVHGFGATVADHWFPWLEAVLPNVVRVRLPDPSRPDAQAWTSGVAEAIGEPDRSTAVVTHSLGGVTALRAVQTLTARSGGSGIGPVLGAFVAVAPFADVLPPSGISELDAFSVAGLQAFLDGLDVEAVRGRLGRSVVIRSDDDPLVPPVLSDRFASNIGAQIVLRTGAGHFLADEGITELPEVVAALAGCAEAAGCAGFGLTRAGAR